MNYHKTEYDLKMATFVTDYYIESARNLVQQLAKDAVEGGGGGQDELKKKQLAKYC